MAHTKDECLAKIEEATDTLAKLSTTGHTDPARSHRETRRYRQQLDEYNRALYPSKFAILRPRRTWMSSILRHPEQFPSSVHASVWYAFLGIVAVGVVFGVAPLIIQGIAEVLRTVF